MHIEERAYQAARKIAGVTVRRVVGSKPEDFEPHKLEWSELTKRQAEIVNTTRSLIDRLEGKSDAEARSIEEAHDFLMSVFDDLDSEKDYRTSLGDRSPRPTGARGDPARRPLSDADEEEIADGRSRGPIETGGDLTYALRPDQRFADHRSSRGRGGSEGYEALSCGQYLRSMILGGRTDLERRALAEGTDSAGGYTVPDILSARLIDLMRASMVTMKAGARTVPLTSDTNNVAKVATDPVPAWRAENAAVAASDPTFAKVTFAPKSLAVLVKVSRELLEDSINMETALPAILTSAMALEVDRVALFGTGTAPEPKGLVNMAGIQSVALNATLASYAPIISARTKVLTANAPGITGVVLHPRDDGALAGLVDTTGQPLNRPAALEKVPFLPTTSVPATGGVGNNEATILTGYFPYLLIGLRSELRIEVLKERFADNLQVGFHAHLRMDVAAENETAFTKVTGVKP